MAANMSSSVLSSPMHSTKSASGSRLMIFLTVAPLDTFWGRISMTFLPMSTSMGSLEAMFCRWTTSSLAWNDAKSLSAFR
jgi:hypothetical protein